MTTDTPEPDAMSPDPERPAIIEGMLERLPRERMWTDAEFAEWLAMFEGALRVYYRLPALRDAV